jgi:two-component system, NtrC family, response regulator AtoC
MLNRSRPHVFLVDDDPALRDSLQLVLKNDFQVSVYASGNEALEVLQKGEKAAIKGGIDLALLDVMMPGIDGIELLKQIKSYYPDVPVIMVSASNTLKTAVQAMKLGAVDFISKPFQIEELIQRIHEGIADHSSSNTYGAKKEEGKDNTAKKVDDVEADYGCIVGTHPLMQEVFTKIDQLAPRDTTVLITGESGTGKELVAKEIHKRSNRSSGSFIAINCAAIPESLVESELFGHEKGSFTHAMEKRLGYFELADGGTIFLDEIGELPQAMQVKLLRVLQEREFFRVGNSKPVSVNVRVIAATNKSLERAVEEGSFRKDLFFRVHVVNIELPPLRKRKEDISSLVEFFITKLSEQYGGKAPQITEEFLACLDGYNWPGNVRELENVIESILALSIEEQLTAEQVPHRIRQSGDSASDMKEAVVEGIIPFEEAEKRFETEIITKALERTNFVQTKAAELLGISRRILKYKMDKLGIAAQDNE